MRRASQQRAAHCGELSGIDPFHARRVWVSSEEPSQFVFSAWLDWSEPMQLPWGA